MYVRMRQNRFRVLHIINMGTGYSGINIVAKTSSEMMIKSLETVWILRHGAPKNLLADSEFTKLLMLRDLANYDMTVAERTVRRHNKLKIIERNHRTPKNIFERMESQCLHIIRRSFPRSSHILLQHFCYIL